jgi:hypothetical protein
MSASFDKRSSIHHVPNHAKRMIATIPVDLDLFTPDELAAGLALILSPESLQGVLAALERIREQERPFYRWAHEVVLAVSDTSPEVAQRVRDYYATTESERTRIEAAQRMFRGWRVATAADPWRVALSPAELLIDGRSTDPRDLGAVFSIEGES